MLKFSLLLLSTILIGCQAKKSGEDFAPKEKEIMLIGVVGPSEFEQTPYVSWYDSVYAAYTPRLGSLVDYSSVLRQIDIDLFFGTWCSDSRRELPAFHKILDALEIDKTKINHIALDRDKLEPGNNQEGKNIEFVPTIIFYSGGKELGRIIENPVNSLEEDIVSILSLIKE